MHIVTLFAGVLSIGIAIYLFLSVAYPFIAPYADQTFGAPVLFLGGLLFGGFGSYICWNSIAEMEDNKVARKINGKRKRKLVALEF